MRKAYIKTLGCQMNVRDSLNMEGLLSERGYQITDDPEKADLILLNTCVIRQKARQKAASQIGSFGKMIGENSDIRVGVCGCMVTSEAEEILERFPFVDFVLGPDSIGELPSVLEALDHGRGKIISKALNTTADGSFIREDEVLRGKAATSFVTVMKGCSNCCSYCVVPSVRGPAVSRGPEEILEVVSGLVKKGVSEVTLLGQSVNSYLWASTNGKEDITFPVLLGRIGKIKDLRRLRFISSHPRDFSDELLDVFENLNVLANHVHLPVQSGSNNVLKIMNRGYTREWYLDRVSALKEARPGIHISTDIIVGYPGESEKDFLDTYNLVKEIEFDHMYVFKYSPRPNTPTLNSDLKPVPEDIKQNRFEKILCTFGSNVQAKHLKMVGTVEQVLVEGRSKSGRGLLTGRTSGNKVVNFYLPGKKDISQSIINRFLGQIVDVKITDGFMHSLKGQLQR